MWGQVSIFLSSKFSGGLTIFYFLKNSVYLHLRVKLSVTLTYLVGLFFEPVYIWLGSVWFPPAIHRNSCTTSPYSTQSNSQALIFKGEWNVGFNYNSNLFPSSFHTALTFPTMFFPIVLLYLPFSNFGFKPSNFQLTELILKYITSSTFFLSTYDFLHWHLRLTFVFPLISRKRWIILGVSEDS